VLIASCSMALSQAGAAWVGLLRHQVCRRLFRSSWLLPASSASGQELQESKYLSNQVQDAIYVALCHSYVAVKPVAKYHLACSQV
jgi:hypothetical protein